MQSLLREQHEDLASLPLVEVAKDGTTIPEEARALLDEAGAPDPKCAVGLDCPAAIRYATE